WAARFGRPLWRGDAGLLRRADGGSCSYVSCRHPLYGGCDTWPANFTENVEGRTMNDQSDPLGPSWAELGWSTASQDERASRLSAITTLWTRLLQAHGGEVDVAAAARHRLLSRYGRGAVPRPLVRPP